MHSSDNNAKMLADHFGWCDPSMNWCDRSTCRRCEFWWRKWKIQEIGYYNPVPDNTFPLHTSHHKASNARQMTKMLKRVRRTRENRNWMDEWDDEMEPLCGESFDHDLREDYVGPDGRQWTCRNCGAEIWEEPEDE